VMGKRERERLRNLILEDAQARGVVMPAGAYNSLLLSFMYEPFDAVKNRRMTEEILEIYERMMAGDVESRPFRATYSILIGMLSRRGNFAKAEELLSRMFESGFRPTTFIHAAMLSGMMLNKQDHRALKRYETLRSHDGSSSPFEGFQPEMHLKLLLQLALSATRVLKPRYLDLLFSDIFKILPDEKLSSGDFDLLQHIGTSPHIHATVAGEYLPEATIVKIIRFAGQSAQVSIANQAWPLFKYTKRAKEMGADYYPPMEAFAYRAAAQIYSGDIKGCLDTLQALKSTGASLDPPLLKQISLAFSRLDPEIVTPYFSGLMQVEAGEGVGGPSVDEVNLVLWYFAYRNDANGAIQMFDSISARFGAEPNLTSVNGVLYSILRSRDASRILENLLQEAEKMKLQLDQESYDYIVRVMIKQNRTQEAVAYIKEAASKGFSLNGRIVSVAITQSLRDRSTELVSQVLKTGLYNELIPSIKEDVENAERMKLLEFDIEKAIGTVQEDDKISMTAQN